jgi:DNA-binding YbaB/EbfC family protein
VTSEDSPGDGLAPDGPADDELDADFDDDDDTAEDDLDEDDAGEDPFAALGALFGGAGFGGAGFGGGGGNPLAGLLEQAQQMQAGMEDAQRRLAEQTVSGTSGGGLVRATVSGTGELQQLRIDPSVVDPTDVETLADLIIAAVRAAAGEARTLGERTMSGALPAGMAGMPDLGAGMIPGAGPVGRPIGDDDSEDDLGPSGAIRG